MNIRIMVAAVVAAIITYWGSFVPPPDQPSQSPVPVAASWHETDGWSWNGGE